MIKKQTAILGAAFLMATSAIGPGFLTQTSLFTQELLASFGFVIGVSILIDIGAQLNIWRIVTMRRQYAQDLANSMVPGLGHVLAALIGFGGLIFNIGNFGGTGLGLNALLGISAETGAIISCVLALAIFWYREAASLIDLLVKMLGLAMIGLTIYVAISSRPPLAEALYRTIWPAKIDVLKIVTLVGGTVGGYISFAGAHRLLQAGIHGPAQLSKVTRSAVSGILLTSFMRFLLFLAALGIVSQGVQLAAGNPAATVFESAAGHAGRIFFGLVLWIASITSVVGASYTTISFWKTLSPLVNRHERIVVSLFIIASALIFVLQGNPVSLLVFAGAINGLILPLALAIMLWAVRRSTASGYHHPAWLQVIGWFVVAVMSWMGFVVISNYFLR